MNDSNNQSNEFLSFKIVQSEEIIKISLTTANLRKKFNDIYFSLLNELKLKQEDTYISNNEGKMIGITDLGLPLEDIIKKFGFKLKLYYEKIF
ncbi:MAG: hypothetical protein ACFE75_07405 [Candidatus Hodarchaeota archaeon]